VVASSAGPQVETPPSPTLGRVRLRVLGSNGTYPTPGRPASGYLVEHADSLVMVDAGPGTVAAFQEWASPGRLDALVVTHIHPDHCSDVPVLYHLFRFGPAVRRGIRALGPDGVADRLVAFMGAGPGDEIMGVFEWQTVGKGDRAQVGEIALAFGIADHPVPTLVTSLEAGGRRLVLSSDTGPGGDLLQMASDADLLVCEATVQGGPGASWWPYHLSAGEAGALARRAGARRLLLTHVAPILDPVRSVDEAKETFGGPVEWAAPGMEVEI
jgi:ribonuclease BN (tRNA processing enzyme)